MHPARYTLATLLDDSPLVWKERAIPDGQPENYDKTFHGQVSLRLALVHSYNVASARLGLDLGLNQVLVHARRLARARAVEQAFEAAPVYLLTSALQDVVSEGTAAGLKEFLPPSLKLAGKTGTTDELRDSWFAGFSGDRPG